MIANCVTTMKNLVLRHTKMEKEREIKKPSPLHQPLPFKMKLKLLLECQNPHQTMLKMVENIPQNVRTHLQSLLKISLKMSMQHKCLPSLILYHPLLV
jgi:hypothetical protein